MPGQVTASKDTISHIRYLMCWTLGDSHFPRHTDQEYTMKNLYFINFLFSYKFLLPPDCTHGDTHMDFFLQKANLHWLKTTKAELSQVRVTKTLPGSVPLALPGLEQLHGLPWTHSSHSSQFWEPPNSALKLFVPVFTWRKWRFPVLILTTVPPPCNSQLQWHQSLALWIMSIYSLLLSPFWKGLFLTKDITEFLSRFWNDFVPHAEHHRGKSAHQTLLSYPDNI